MTHQTQPIGSDDLNAYVDGSLVPAERQRVEAAIATDPNLASEFADLTAVRGLLANLEIHTPSRSFQLGDQHRPASPTHKPALLRVLPVMRTLSVAAVLLFLVVGGSLMLDINGKTTDNTSQTFAAQDETMHSMSETDEGDHASEGAEDAASNEAPAPAAEAHDKEESSLTEQGESANAGDRPEGDLSRGAEDSESGSSQPAADSELFSDHTLWTWIIAAFGALAIVFTLFWISLDRSMRHQPVSRT